MRWGGIGDLSRFKKGTTVSCIVIVCSPRLRIDLLRQRKSQPSAMGRTRPRITLAFVTKGQSLIENSNLRSPIVTTSEPLMLKPTSVWGEKRNFWKVGFLRIKSSAIQVVLQPVSTKALIIVLPNFNSISATMSGRSSWVRLALGFLPTATWASADVVAKNPHCCCEVESGVQAGRYRVVSGTRPVVGNQCSYLAQGVYYCSVG